MIKKLIPPYSKHTRLYYKRHRLNAVGKQSVFTVTVTGSIQTHKKESSKLLTFMGVVQYSNQCVLKEGNIDTQNSCFS